LVFPASIGNLFFFRITEFANPRTSSFFLAVHVLLTPSSIESIRSGTPSGGGDTFSFTVLSHPSFGIIPPPPPPFPPYLGPICLDRSPSRHSFPFTGIWFVEGFLFSGLPLYFTSPPPFLRRNLCAYASLITAIYFFFVTLTDFSPKGKPNGPLPIFFFTFPPRSVSSPLMTWRNCVERLTPASIATLTLPSGLSSPGQPAVSV